MSDLQKFTKRHFFQHEDKRSYMPKWNRIKKPRMWGVRIDPDFNRFHYLIWHYTFSRICSELKDVIPGSEFRKKEFELLIYLVHKNRGVTTQDIMNFPLGYNAMAASRQVKRFKDFGILERFEGHGSAHHRGIVYRITSRAKSWIADMNSMQLGFKKMPVFSSLCTDKSVCEDVKRKRNVPNWRSAVTEFNQWVDETRNEYKSII